MNGPAAGVDRSAQRARMISEQLVQRGITCPRVLEAFCRVPRELFVPPHLADRAYEDSALPVDCSQTISQPYMVALMTERLELTPDSRVLEIGTGTGYQTALLALLAGQVYTIEWHLKLMTAASQRLEELGLNNVRFRCGDGSLGWPEEAPFDAIIVTAGAPDVPEPLCGQLVPGGRLVVPIGPTDDQTLVLVKRAGQSFERREVIKCRFVKLLGKAGWAE
jgi:protein-L-isoaspartate(D-aspartate) O-methyltransferase